MDQLIEEEEVAYFRERIVEALKVPAEYLGPWALSTHTGENND